MTDGIAVVVPRESNNDDLVVLIKWHFADGDAVQADEVVAEVEGSKATFEVVAPCAGFIKRIAAEGEEVAIGATLCRLYATWETADAESDEPEAPRAGEVHVVASQGHGIVRFSRRARELIEERSLDEASFAGEGLIRSSDVLARLGEASRPAASAPRTTYADAAMPVPADSRGAVLQGPATSRPLTPRKRTEVRSIRSAYHHVLQSSVTVCAPTRGLKAAMAACKISGVSTTALMAYETGRLLRKYPLFNAYYDDGDAYVYDDVNIAVAVDVGSGLKVPVLRNVDKKSLEEISLELRELLVAYASDTLTAADQSGGTFTITDLSGEGAFLIEPLINKGQSSILGVGAEFFPGAGNAGFFNLTLRFDHQLAEGRAAAAFLTDLRDRLAGYESAFGRGLHEDSRKPRCSRCDRDHAELRALNHYLVQTINSDSSNGAVCTGCLQGR